MMKVEPIELDGNTAIAIEVKLPKTTLLVVTTDKGYIMCGALDVALLNERLSDRQIIAARATGVKTIDELLDAPLESVTHTAEEIGIFAGMTGRDAIRKMM
ncbi:YunC family protein [Paenibacillus chitinolyticus]|uniref:YunC family protein n=1 Tax=Paenibacillus chitinolyticus TaxID=79263 RepID=UPI00366D35A0